MTASSIGDLLTYNYSKYIIENSKLKKLYTANKFTNHGINFEDLS